MSSGNIVQVIGAVVDVKFPHDSLPKVYDALRIEDRDLTLEVQQQLGDGVVRAIAMGPSEGLSRGIKVDGTGQPIQVPVGQKTLGRIMDVLGKPVDHAGPIGEEIRMPIHRAAPAYEDQASATELLETGIKVIDLIMPICQGRQDRPVRRRRRRQDRDADGTHQQHRKRARRVLRVRRCG